MLLTATFLRLLALPTILLFFQVKSGASDPDDSCIGDDCPEVVKDAWGIAKRNPKKTIAGVLVLGGLALYNQKDIVNFGSRGLNGFIGLFKAASTVAPPSEREAPLPAPEKPGFADNVLEVLENHWMWLIGLAVGLVCCCCCCVTLGRCLWRRYRYRYRKKKDLKHRPNRYYEREERKEWFPTTTTTITPSTGPNVIFGMGPSTPPGDFDGSQRRASTRSTRQQRPQSASPFGVPGNVQGSVTPTQPGAFGQPQNQQMSASGRFPQANQGFQQTQSGFQQQQLAPQQQPLASPSPQQPAGYQNQFQRGPSMAQQRPPPPANFPGQPRAPFGQQQPQRPPPAQNYPQQQQYYRR